MPKVLRDMRYAMDRLYDRYNDRRYVHPDPLEFLYGYEDPLDREIVGLVAAGLAYGRVMQILRSVRWVLDRLGPHPRAFLEDVRPVDLREMLMGFKHRWTTGEELADLLLGIQRMIAGHGALRCAMLAHLHREHDTVQPALAAFVEEFRRGCRLPRNSLVPQVAAGSACKRMHLYLRWMVRRDGVDPGTWTEISPARLLVPLDTHMHRLCLGLGLTASRQANMKCVLEITEGLRRVCPADPIRYDFALTRLGIRKDLDETEFLRQCQPTCRRGVIPGATQTRGNNG